MIKFLHLADLHLGVSPAFLDHLADQRYKDYLNAFERAVDYAIRPENQIDFVIIAGDFFDSPHPSKEVIRFSINQFKRLRQAKIPVTLTPGNHDGISYPRCVYKDPDYGLREYINIVDSPNIKHVLHSEFHGEEVYFYGMAWDFINSNPPFDNFKRQNNDGYHIAIAHGSVIGGLFSDAYSRDIPLDLKNLANTGMDYIALGHIHSYQLNKAGSIPVVYPGTLESCRFSPGEEGDRFLVVVTLDKDHDPAIERIKWNRKTYLNVKLDVGKLLIDSQKELIDHILKQYQGENNIVKIELVGDSACLINKDKLLSRLFGNFFWLSIEDNTFVFNNEIVENWSREDTIRGLYIRNLQDLLENTESIDKKNLINLALKLAVLSFEKSK